MQPKLTWKKHRTYYRRMKMKNNYKDTPMYHWYLAKGRIEGNIHSVWHKGKQYISYAKEVDRYTMHLNKIIYVGYGDINYVKSL